MKSPSPEIKTTQAFLIPRMFKTVVIACNESEHLGQCVCLYFKADTHRNRERKSLPTAYLQCFPTLFLNRKMKDTLNMIWYYVSLTIFALKFDLITHDVTQHFGIMVQEGQV